MINEQENNLKKDYWDGLPEFDLYMDQVVSFMEKYLEPFKVTGDEKTITPSMINNYTKDGLVPRPNRKRYSRRHLASLAIVCMLKPVLPITDIKQILSSFNSSEDEFKEIYSVFCKAQKTAFTVTLNESNSFKSDNTSYTENGKKLLCLRAVEMVAMSNAYRIAAQKLIEMAKEN